MNMIRAVQGDSQGLLWIATDQGLSRLDRKTGQVTSTGTMQGMSTVCLLIPSTQSAKTGQEHFGLAQRVEGSTALILRRDDSSAIDTTR